MEPRDVWAATRGVTLRMAAYDAAAPDGAAVVVLHGLGTGIDVLRDAVPGLDPFARLAAEGLHVLAMDWPGHGRSGGPRGHLTYRLAMDAVATAVEAARERWEAPVGLFGTALGGVLGFYAALEEGAVGAVACHNVLDLRDVRAVLQRARQGVLLPAAGLIHRRLGAALQSRVRVPTSAIVATADLAADPVLARRLRSHPQAVRSYDLAALATIFLTAEEKPDIAAQKTPTLIAVGTGDRVLPETPTRVFASRLTCPSRLWVLPGGGHQLLLEHSEALVPVVAGFLREHLAG